MNWDIPDWWAFTLLALAAFRVFHLIAEDTILDRPRDWTTERLGEKWEAFITCPYCAGFYVSVLWWLAWVWQPHWTLVVATPLAINAVLAVVANRADD